MKKLFFILSMICLTFLSTTSCTPDPCEKVKIGAKFADLLLNAFKSLITSTSGGQVGYDITHTVINSVGEIVCNNEVASANNHSDSLNLIYSEDEDFTNPINVTQRKANITMPTEGSKTYNVKSSIVFTQAGYYKVQNIIDNTNAVEERSENNNINFNVPTGRVKNNFIHITDEMLGKKNTSAPDTNKYISKWDVDVVYDVR